MLTGRPTRLKTFDYAGFHRYSLTFCTYARRPLFRNARAVDVVLCQILRAAVEQTFAVVAYRFMPDHLHLLVEGRSEVADGARFITAAKQYSGFHYSKEYRVRLWQPYGYERTLRADEDSRTVARYILANQVRAGLVPRVTDYAYVGSQVYELKDLILSIDI